jgi:uncharacterized membrane protein (DUF4010 family)
LAAAVIMIASTVVFGRVLVEIGVVAAGSFRALAPPLAGMLAWCGLIATGAWLLTRRHETALVEQGNPAHLKTALVFGALYAFVIMAIAAAKDHFGTGGLYGVAALSGLTDMDAVTLSTAQLVNQNRLEAATGWRLILLASLTNLVFKAAIVVLLGGRALARRIVLLFAAAVGGGLVIFAVWPS